ncbi:hypothetical protein P171DRAFT_435791 [Karstenula rhodostoma CBS 690.94]|uniref:Secreted protein n=1 Tax=Karstenula rhodostoma CBS 690.94 TaxID=1392251 RepID=A0A9P4U7L4_9PLEO|nr:hypothetical protein P171DRAFT_435791 [Karstenula rhodostoma CBS 690.94]
MFSFIGVSVTLLLAHLESNGTKRNQSGQAARLPVTCPASLTEARVSASAVVPPIGRWGSHPAAPFRRYIHRSCARQPSTSHAHVCVCAPEEAMLRGTSARAQED